MSGSSSQRVHKSLWNTTLLVVGLGYVVDAFDLILYNILRMPSLHDLGLSGDAIVKTGLNILSIQVTGMLVGGFVWGILGDKIGRKKALVGSILFYAFGSLGCAIVPNVEAYMLLRFITGIGLAGEIGLGAVLITETMPDKSRNWGIGIFTICAYIGIVLATIAATVFPWRECYAIGGVTGLIILLGRIFLFESELFKSLTKQTKIKRGSLKMLLGKPALLKRWLCCIFFMMPYFFVVNVLISLAPEFAKAVGVTAEIKTSSALLVYSFCAMLGTILSVVASNRLRKRIATIAIFMAINLLLAAYYLFQKQTSEIGFYIVCCIMGMSNYFALQLFAATEQFGTNMRATAGTSAINIGRTTLVITNSIFLAFKSSGLDIIHAGTYTGAIVFAIGFVCLLGLRETYHQSMDFLEEA